MSKNQGNVSGSALGKGYPNKASPQNMDHQGLVLFAKQLSPSEFQHPKKITKKLSANNTTADLLNIVG